MRYGLVVVCGLAAVLAGGSAAADHLLTDLDEAGIGAMLVPDPELGAIVCDSEKVLAGKTSLRFEFAQGDPVIWQLADPLPCEPGALYALKAQVRCFLLGSAGVRLFAEWLDAAGAPIHVKTEFWGQRLFEDASPWIGATSAWAPASLVARAPETATQVRFGCRLESVRPGRERKNRRYAWLDALCWGKVADITFSSEAPSNVFQGEPVTLVAEACEQAPCRVEATLHNFWDKMLGSYQWSVSGPASTYRLDFDRLDPGYYELRWRAAGGAGFLDREGTTRFCILPPLEEAPIRPAAMAIDGALSWFYRGEELGRACEMCRRLGVQVIRDRLNWDQIEPERGGFDPSLIETSTKVQNGAGMEVYQDFSSTPPWAVAAPGPPRSLPDDPLDLYRIMKTAAAYFAGRIDYWEIWNEPYHPTHFRGRPDEYVSYLKAAYLGLRAGNPEAVVLTASFNTSPGLWEHRIFENGALEYADIYNFHSYGRREEVVSNIVAHKQEMLDAGHRLPMWLTEDGSKSRRDVHGSELVGQQRCAWYAVERAVMTFAEGVDRYFYFAFPEMYEGAEGPWGLVAEDLTPKPTYVACGALRRMLGRARYLGSVVLSPGKLPGYLFGRGDGSAVIVVFPEKQRHIRVPGAGAATRPVDIMGNDRELPHIVTEEHVLEVETGVFPLFIGPLDPAAFEVEPPEDPWPRLDRARLSDPTAKQVWFRIEMRGAELDDAPEGLVGSLRDAVQVPAGGAALPARVVAYNLSEAEATIEVEAELPEGASLEPAGPLTIELPAGASVAREVMLHAPAMAAGAESRLVFQGAAEGFQVTPTVIYLRPASGGTE